MQLQTIAANFHGTTVDIISHDNRKWLTAEQIGLCLGYNPANASAGIRNLYNRNIEEFSDTDACRINLMRQGQNRESLIFSVTGCNLLGFFSNTARAKEFRAWAKQVLAGMVSTDSVPQMLHSSLMPRVTRAIEFDALNLFVQGWSQKAISTRLDISLSTVNMLLHGRYRFSEHAGKDQTTPELLQAVVDRHVASERMRIRQKFCASAANQTLQALMDGSGVQILD